MANEEKALYKQNSQKRGIHFTVFKDTGLAILPPDLHI